MMLKNHFLDHYHDEDDDDEVSPWILNGMLRSDKLEACMRRRERGMRAGREKGWWPGRNPMRKEKYWANLTSQTMKDQVVSRHKRGRQESAGFGKALRIDWGTTPES